MCSLRRDLIQQTHSGYTRDSAVTSVYPSSGLVSCTQCFGEGCEATGSVRGVVRPSKGGYGYARVIIQCQEPLGKSQHKVHCILVTSLRAAGIFCARDAAGVIIIIGIGPCCHHPLQDPTQRSPAQGIAVGCIIHLWSQACLCWDPLSFTPKPSSVYWRTFAVTWDYPRDQGKGGQLLVASLDYSTWGIVSRSLKFLRSTKGDW